MSGERLSSRAGKKIGLGRRQFLGGALGVVAAGSLLETAAALAAKSPTPKAKLWIGAATADITPQPPMVAPRAGENSR